MILNQGVIPVYPWLRKVVKPWNVSSISVGHHTKSTFIMTTFVLSSFVHLAFNYQQGIPLLGAKLFEFALKAPPLFINLPTSLYQNTMSRNVVYNITNLLCLSSPKKSKALDTMPYIHVNLHMLGYNILIYGTIQKILLGEWWLFDFLQWNFDVVFSYMATILKIGRIWLPPFVDWQNLGTPTYILKKTHLYMCYNILFELF